MGSSLLHRRNRGASNCLDQAGNSSRPTRRWHWLLPPQAFRETGHVAYLTDAFARPPAESTRSARPFSYILPRSALRPLQPVIAEYTLDVFALFAGRRIVNVRY